MCFVGTFLLCWFPGTVFLWMYWPSFNAALVAPDYVAQHRSVINTYFSLSAACVTTFALSPIFQRNGGKWRLSMVRKLRAMARVRFPDPASYVGGVCCWFSSLLEGFFSEYSDFPSSTKTNIPRFQFELETVPERATLWKPMKFPFIYLFISHHFFNSLLLTIDENRKKPRV